MGAVVIQLSQDRAALFALCREKPLELPLREHDDPAKLIRIQPQDLLHLHRHIIRILTSLAMKEHVFFFRQDGFLHRTLRVSFFAPVHPARNGIGSARIGKCQSDAHFLPVAA